MARVVGGWFRRGTHVHTWLIHVDVWQKPPQYGIVISPQLKEVNYFFLIKKKKKGDRDPPGGESRASGEFLREKERHCVHIMKGSIQCIRKSMMQETGELQEAFLNREEACCQGKQRCSSLILLILSQ